MAQRRVEVNLAVNADISQAQANLQNLQQSLSKISSIKYDKGMPLTDNLREASNAATDLQQHLTAAFNVKTGNIDFKKLNASLKTSGQSLSTLSSQLLKAGMDGEQAFLQLHRSIVNANISLTKSQSKLQEFAVTLKNTAKWQISSSLLHGFMSAVQSAYDYAQDLNKSLNNIRIVTGQNTEQMAKFAVQANKAAQALSTTTTTYTDAALIYYQQGLDDKAVKDRTDTTIKMANVARESATEVSSYMTAIWNNFNRAGDESSEHFADVLTKLGAETAANTAEIAAGLEKYAAIANTIGLSYDYAASAITTIVDKTRASADTVGTSLKTIFARIQGLSLGESLEDGTDLNKYSLALNKVGVNIKDTAGNLKDMDQILDETGAKWTSLSKDTQMAVAQTVAGVRQYTQFIALMDNWDSFQQNVTRAETADGTLEKQADIYAESWEAASKRVKAAAQDIYSSLLDDKFFIKITDGFAGVLKVINTMVDTVGGLKGIFILASTIIMTKFQPQIVTALDAGIQKVDALRNKVSEAFSAASAEKGAKKITAFSSNITGEGTLPEQAKKSTDLLSAAMNTKVPVTAGFKAEISGLQEINDLNNKILLNKKALTQEQREQLSLELDKAKAITEIVAKAQNELELAQQQQRIDKDKAINESADIMSFSLDEEGFVSSGDIAILEEYKEKTAEIQGIIRDITGVTLEIDEEEQRIKGSIEDIYTAQETVLDEITEEIQLREEINAILNDSSQSGEDRIGSVNNKLKELSASGGQLGKIATEILAKTKSNTTEVESYGKTVKIVLNNAGKSANVVAKQLGLSSNAISKVSKNAIVLNRSLTQVNQRTAQSKNQLDSISKTLDGMLAKSQSVVATIFTGVTAVSKAAFAFSTIKNAIDQIKSPNVDWTQKMVSGAMAATAAVSGIKVVLDMVSAAQARFNSALDGANAKQSILIALLKLRANEENKEVLSLLGLRAAKMLDRGIDEDTVKTNMSKIIVKRLGIKTNQAEALSETMLSVAKAGGSKADLYAAITKKLSNLEGTKSIPIKLANIALNWAETSSLTPLAAITIILVGALAALALATAAVVYVGSRLVNIYNEDANAAERAEEAAKNLAENYNTCKQEYEDMISAMENYKTAREGLDSLTKGTEEYAEALRDANHQAMELINTYKLQEGTDYSWQGDELVINDDALKRVKQEKSQEVNNAYAASQMANVSAQNARAKSDATNLRRKNDSGDFWAAMGINLVSGLFNPMTALVATGTSIAALVEKNTKEDQAIEKAVAAYQKDSSLFTGDNETIRKNLKATLNIDDKNLIDAIMKSKDEIINLADELNAAEQAFSLAAANTAKEVLSTDEKVQSSQNADRISQAGGKIYEAIYKDLEHNVGGSLKTHIFGIGSKEMKETFKQYQKEAGLDQLNGFKVTNYRSDGGVEYKYVDENGETQKRTATKEAIAATLATAQANDKLAEAAEKLVATFDKLDNSGQNFDQALKNFLTSQNFELSTKAESMALFNQVDSNQDNTINSQDNSSIKQYLSAKLDIDFGDEVAATARAKELGFDTADELIEAFKLKLTDIQEAWGSIKLPDNFAGADEMSLETAQAFYNSFQNINLGPLGEEAGKQFTDGINKMVADLDPEKQKEALSQLASIDWSEWDALDQARKLMKELGVEIDVSSGYWIAFANNMRQATGAIQDFSKIKTDLAEVSKILSSLEFGKTISDDDFKRLTDYKSEWEDFFILQADGTRKFIGNQQAMQQVTQDNIQAQRDKLTQDRQIQENFKNVTWTVNGTKTQNVDWSQYTSDATGIQVATNLKNSNGAVEEALEVLGYSDDVLNKIISKANENDAQAKAQLEEMFERLEAFENRVFEKDAEELNEMMASTAASLEELNALLAQGEITTDAYKKQFEALSHEAANAATSLSELDAIKSGFNLQDNDEAYTQGLVNLGKQYTSCAEAVHKYQTALSELNNSPEKTAALETAEDTLRGLIALEEGAKKYSLEVDTLRVQSKQLAQAYGLTAEEAANLAIQNQRMNKGILTLVDNWDDWKKTLTETDKLTEDYASAVVKTTKAIADLVGATEDLELPAEFFDTTNMALLEQAMQGNIKAINQLGAAVSAAQVNMLEWNETMATSSMVAEIVNEWDNQEIVIDVLLDETQFEADKTVVLQGIEDIKNGTIASGQALSDDWVASLNRMALATGMSVEQMNSILGSLGVQAKVTTTDVTEEMDIPTYYDVYEEVPSSTVSSKNTAPGKPTPYVYKKATIPGPTEKYYGTHQVAQISTDDNPLTLKVEDGGSVTKKSGTRAPAVFAGNRGSVSPSSTQGSNPAEDKFDTTDKDDVIERYKEINDQLDNISDAYDRLNKQQDRLYGNTRLENMKKQSKVLENQINLLKQRNAQEKQYLQQDKAALSKAASDMGVQFQIGENGDLLNYTEQMEIAYSRLRAVEDYVNNKNNFANKDQQDEYQKNTVDVVSRRVTALKDAVDQYYETLEQIEDTEQEIIDAFNTWQDNNLEIIKHGVEVKIDFDEERLKLLDYYVEKLSDNIFTLAEGFALLKDQSAITVDKLGIYEQEFKDLQADFNAGKISIEGFSTGLKETSESIFENIQNIDDLKDSMKDYYSDSLSKVVEEIDKYITHNKNLNSSLDHYKNIIALSNGEKDYKSIGKVLAAQQQVKRNAMEIARENEAMLLNQKEEIQKSYEEATDPLQKEMWKKSLDEIIVEYDKAHEEALSTTEEWAQSVKDTVQNTLDEISDDLEKALTNGRGFDFLNQSMSLDEKITDEWLTKTNQVYETQKMMRAAEQKADKLTSKLGKERLLQFNKETKALQEKTKLSKLELEIQQAKYDQLLAEIALEESQNTKNSVSLQRDSEGNYGYVYTADKDSIAKAEQELDDAKNKLYNIGLEATNKYGKQILQYTQEYKEAIDELKQLRHENLIDDEEYQIRKNALDAKYGKLLSDSNYLRFIAQTAEVTKENEELYNLKVQTLNDHEEAEKAHAERQKEVRAKAYETANNQLLDYADQQKWDRTELNAALDGINRDQYSDEASYQEDRNKLIKNWYITHHSESEDGMKLIRTTTDDIDNKINEDEATYQRTRNSQMTTANTKLSELATSLSNDQSEAARIAKEAEVNHYETSIETANTWSEKVPEAEEEVENALKSEGDTLNGPGGVNDALGDVDQSTNDVVDESNKLTDTLTGYGGLISALESELLAVKNTGDQYSILYSQLETTRLKYLDLMNQINNTREALEKLHIEEGKSANQSGSAGGGTYNTPSGTTTTENSSLIEQLGRNIGQIFAHFSRASDINAKYEEKGIKKGQRIQLKPGVKATAITYDNRGNQMFADPNYGTAGGSYTVVATYGDTVILEQTKRQGRVVREVRVNKSSIVGYDTGGYTGNWGPAGKIAMLHEKEMVLNKSDTKNMLTSVTLLRDIVKTINLNSATTGLSNLPKITEKLNTSTSPIEQIVHITADFPGVQDHNEIELALTDLVNSTMQYAYRR